MVATKLKNLTIENLANGKISIITDISKNYKYEDGKRGAEDGLKVTVCFPQNGYEKQTIKVMGNCEVTEDMLKESSQPIFVEFSGLETKVYVMNNVAQISATAKTCTIVKSNKPA